MRNLLTLEEFTPQELRDLISLSFKIKKKPRKYRKRLREKQIVMIFEKPSLRTRLSFELGIEQMGGNAVFYPMQESTIGHKETWEDFAHVVSSYSDHGIVCRLFAHKDIERIAAASKIPVINALTNEHHPMQAIADFMTIYEKKKTYRVTIAYVGDAKNNVTHSLMIASRILGAKMNIAFPKGYAPLPEIYEKTKSCVQLFTDPDQAVKDADIIYTDSWMSYNIAEKEKAKRIKALQGYQVNTKLLSHARPNALVMHCLPATRGMEITNEIIDGNQSIIFQQAENRLHTTKAVLLTVLKEKEKK